MSSWGRAATTTALCALGVLGMAAPGHATPTDNTRDSGSHAFTSTRFCDVPVRIESSWDAMVHTFYDASGTATRLAFTGTVRISYTNTVTGASFSPNSSGPGTIDLATGQTWIRGSNGAVVSSDGILTTTEGRIIYDAAGDIISIVGHVRPVCEEIGAHSL
jgi:hypothetical protein